MAIRKQEFYEGAALCILAKANGLERVIYRPPFFLLNDEISVLLKYCTKVRSPWGFTFTPDEQAQLKQSGARKRTVIGLVCGADGVAALDYPDFLKIASPRHIAIHVACYRGHWEHYEVTGPDGALARKIAPSEWQRIVQPEAAVA